MAAPSKLSASRLGMQYIPATILAAKRNMRLKHTRTYVARAEAGKQPKCNYLHRARLTVSVQGHAAIIHTRQTTTMT